MRVTSYEHVERDGKRHAEVCVDNMTLEEAESLFKALNTIENPKPFIKALTINLKRKLFKK